VTITATCNSDSSIKITKQVSVSAKSIDTAKVSVADQTYTGSALTPTVTVSLEGKTLTQDVDYSVSYSNNTDIGTATVTIIGKSNYSGTIQASFSIKASSISMYRLYNPNSGEHFYTSSASEKTTLVSAGWHYEGIGWTAPSVSSTPVYRLYNPNAGDHFYTSDASERDHLVSVGWNYEGIGWQSADSSGVPLYRQYNPNAIAGSHNYTTDKSESDKLVSLGWHYEGIAWYGVSSSE
jgi:hypothetical protein